MRLIEKADKIESKSSGTSRSSLSFWYKGMYDLETVYSGRDHGWPFTRKRSEPFAKDAGSSLDVTRRRSSPPIRGLSGGVV